MPRIAALDRDLVSTEYVLCYQGSPPLPYHKKLTQDRYILLCLPSSFPVLLDSLALVP